MFSVCFREAGIMMFAGLFSLNNHVLIACERQQATELTNYSELQISCLFGQVVHSLSNLNTRTPLLFGRKTKIFLSSPQLLSTPCGLFSPSSPI